MRAHLLQGGAAYPGATDPGATDPGADDIATGIS
jgi:hypothetical protein